MTRPRKAVTMKLGKYKIPSSFKGELSAIQVKYDDGSIAIYCLHWGMTILMSEDLDDSFFIDADVKSVQETK